MIKPDRQVGFEVMSREQAIDMVEGQINAMIEKNDDEPRCPYCAETRLIERVSRPIWASKGLSLWFCQVCSRTWLWRQAQG